MGAAIGVVGASGYTGAEILRYALGHPGLEPVLATSREFAGRPVNEVYRNLPTTLTFSELDLDDLPDLDVIFLALPHGASARTAAALRARGARVVDLSADTRFDDAAIYPGWFGSEHPEPQLLAEAVYGLPELHRDRIAGANLVANPGCYPTAALLAMFPFVRAGVVDTTSIVVSAASGVSGAGRSVAPGVHFSHVDANLKAYGAPTHKHTPEIEQELSRIAGSSVTITFVPHLVPMPRGLLCTAVAQLTARTDVAEILQEAYRHEPFVDVLGTWPETKFVAGSNRAHVHATSDPRTGRVIVSCAIDNLGKGAAGQAIQNANLMLGLEEFAGLSGSGIYP